MLSTRLRLALVAVTLASVLGVSAVALASNSTPPTLVSPAAGASVPAGRVTLVVSDPGLTGAVATLVFLVITHRRTLDSHGHLRVANRCRTRCEFAQTTRWAGHPGLWIYSAKYRIPGYWGVTPGVYYWQAHHYVPSCQPSCEEFSAIHKFRVTG